MAFQQKRFSGLQCYIFFAGEAGFDALLIAVCLARFEINELDLDGTRQKGTKLQAIDLGI